MFHLGPNGIHQNMNTIVSGHFEEDWYLLIVKNVILDMLEAFRVHAKQFVLLITVKEMVIP